MVVCVQQNAKDDSNVDLDVLQAAINLSRRDKFLRDRASRRVAMKRLYQGHPVGTLRQEGVSECSEVLGATFILILILYRICSKRSRAQAARIKICNQAAVVRAVKADRADHAEIKGGTVTDHKSSNRKAECNVITAKTVACTSKDHTVDPPNHEAGCSANFMASTFPTLAVGVFDVRGHVQYLRAVIRQRLLMSGDVELNPGPLDGMMSFTLKFSIHNKIISHSKSLLVHVKCV